MKLLVSFALPLMFGNIFQQLYTVIDTAIVGRGVGLNALAALGTVDWLNWMWIGIAQGFTQGFGVRISQKYGGGDEAGLRQIAGQSAVISAIIALACVLVGQILLPVFTQMLRIPADLQAMAAIYYRILLFGFPAVMFYNYCSSVLRAIGDSKTPLYAMIAASVVNIGLDVLTVFVWKWGIAGAAVATVFAQCLSGAICALKIWKMPLLHFGKAELKRSWAVICDLLKIGTPVAVKYVIIALGGMVVQAVVNGFGKSFIAGFTATNKLYGLLEIAAISYGYAITTYVGQNFGAAQPKRIRKGMRAAVGLSLITSSVISILMLLFGKQITMLFISSEDPTLAVSAGKTAYDYLCAMSVCLPVLYLLFVYQSALQGLGDTVRSMISGIVEFVLRVGGSILIAATGYRNGIFGAEVSAWVGAAIYLAICYYYSFQKHIRSKHL